MKVLHETQEIRKGLSSDFMHYQLPAWCAGSGAFFELNLSKPFDTCMFVGIRDLTSLNDGGFHRWPLRSHRYRTETDICINTVAPACD